MIVLAALLCQPFATVPARVSGGEPEAAAAAAWLAASRGGAAGDWSLVYERAAAGGMWVGKLIDSAGELATVYRAPDGTYGGSDLFATRQRAAVAAQGVFEARADAALEEAVADASAVKEIPVAIWVSADTQSAVADVIARHPGVAWLGDRPLVGDLDVMRAVRAELWEARRGAYAAAQASVREQVEALGGRVAYASTSAPVLFADMPAGRVAELAERRGVASLGLEQTWSTQMSAAGPAVDANWTSGTEDNGAGVRVAVVEYHNVRGSGDLTGKVVASHSTSGRLAYTSSGQFDHPTWVAGAVASQSSTYRGVAPGARIVSSGTGGYKPSLTYDRAVVAAADWAIAPNGGDADIVNTSLVQDTTTGAEEARRYFDAIAWEGGRLPVSAAGNYVNLNSWAVGSPGTGWNVLTVGGVDDRGTAGRADDRLWYMPGSNGACYLDPPGTAWNAHGDFNKPNLVAPSVAVRTANGLAATGTSVGTPIVAGIAAQVIARRPDLALVPEATRAIVMASAIHHVPMPNGARDVDHEGVGMGNAKWAGGILNNGDGTYGGSRYGVMGRGDRPSIPISVTAGQRVRVVLAWSSHTSGSSMLGKADSLRSDLDLRVVQPGGAASGSWTLDNSYEWVEFTATATGTATIEVLHDRFETDAEPYAVAWAKVRPAPTMSRLAGSDRYGSAAAISRATFAAGVPVAYVATGESFPDALAAGPVAAGAGGPMLLTARHVVPTATADELRRLTPGRIVVLGGTRAVSDSTLAALRAFTSGSVSRIAGGDRYGTAVAVSRAGFPSGAPVTFVATGASFPDALVAGPAAALRGGPILLTRRAELPAGVAAELKRLKPSTIYVLGGETAVSAEVVQQLSSLGGATVVRLGGADRFATARAVSARFFPSASTAYLATGMNFPDALAGVPAAARSSSPLLLTSSSLPAPTRSELLRLLPRRIVVLGGTAAVPASVVSEVRAALSP